MVLGDKKDNKPTNTEAARVRVVKVSLEQIQKLLSINP